MRRQIAFPKPSDVHRISSNYYPNTNVMAGPKPATSQSIAMEPKPDPKKAPSAISKMATRNMGRRRKACDFCRGWKEKCVFGTLGARCAWCTKKHLLCSNDFMTVLIRAAKYQELVDAEEIAGAASDADMYEAALIEAGLA